MRIEKILECGGRGGSRFPISSGRYSMMTLFELVVVGKPGLSMVFDESSVEGHVEHMVEFGRPNGGHL